MKNAREKWFDMCSRDYKVQENYEGDGRNMLPHSSIPSLVIYSNSCWKIKIISLHDTNNVVYKH